MNATVIAETIRRHLTNVFFITYLIFLLMVAAAVSMFQSAGTLWPALVSLLAVVAGAGLIGPEFSSGTLQLIVSKPVRRATYLLSRFAGVIVVVTLAAAAAFLTESGLRFVRDAPLPWNELNAKLVNTIAGAMLIAALLALLGSLTRAWFNVAIYFALQIALSISMAILGLLRARGTWNDPLLERAIAAVDQTLFPEAAGGMDPEWLLRVGATAAVALVLACLAFQRREVPYGAD
ncbi:MAG TPA: ABC transporter permease subunit [Thermoanaerobaculia bacterium]|nr:ABC transporter permease subunit [Thermoanaerobaculia bacterium]